MFVCWIKWLVNWNLWDCGELAGWDTIQNRTPYCQQYEKGAVAVLWPVVSPRSPRWFSLPTCDAGGLSWSLSSAERAPAPGPLLCPGCRGWAEPLFPHKGEERRALNLASWARAYPNPAMPETLGKEAVCQTYGWNMLCSSHPRLAYGLPSTAASWALIYTGPENQGP